MFVKKELIHIIRDPRTLTILFGMPIIQILVFGYGITNEIKDAYIAILDMSKDKVTQEITNKILSSDYFKLAENLNTPDDIEKVFRKGYVKQVIVFEDNFAEKLIRNQKANINIIADATDPNIGTSLVYYTTSIIRNYQQENIKINNLPLTIIPEVKMRYNPYLKGVYLFIPGLITILLMLVSAMMTSISITREKELGSMELLLASPMKPIMVIIAKVLPYLLLSFINASVILSMGYFVFGVPITGSLFLLMLECILFILTALSLGILISSITDSQQVALMLSLVGLMMPTILLSGFIFPIENMPYILQLLSYIIPAKWFITIVKDIMLKGSGIELLWKETLILVGFTIFFILISVKKYKVRL